MLALLRPAHRIISSKIVVLAVSHEKIGNRAATAVTAIVASLAVLVISFHSIALTR
jgi:hypothetical protein